VLSNIKEHLKMLLINKDIFTLNNIFTKLLLKLVIEF